MLNFIKKHLRLFKPWFHSPPAAPSKTFKSQQVCDYCQGTGLVERQEPKEMYIPSRYREYSPPVALPHSKPCPKCLGKGVLEQEIFE